MRSGHFRLQRWRLLIGTGVLTSVVLSTACASWKEISTLERRAQEINSVVMCPVCPGESIDQSQHPLAKRMRAIVMEKLGEGLTDDQVKTYLVEGYGPMVLLEPPREGSSLIVWLVPPVALGLGALLLFATFRLMLRPQLGRRETGDAVGLSEGERAVYFRRIEATLASDTGERLGEAAVGSSDATTEGPK
mgnify:CR=1 FL=1